MGKNKILVVYFSATGRTREIAKKISKTLNADLHEIKPLIPYNESDLNWNDKSSRSYKEWKDKTIKPDISNRIEEFDDYDVILIGYPIWWEKAPNIVVHFLESYNFSRKIIIPFSTSGGSIRGSIGLHLRKYTTKDCIWKRGKLFRKVPSEKEITNWIHKIL